MEVSLIQEGVETSGLFFMPGSVTWDPDRKIRVYGPGQYSLLGNAVDVYRRVDGAIVADLNLEDVRYYDLIQDNQIFVSSEFRLEKTRLICDFKKRLVADTQIMDITLTPNYTFPKTTSFLEKNGN